LDKWLDWLIRLAPDQLVGRRAGPLGVSLRVDGDSLNVSAPRAIWTLDLRAEVAEQKPVIIVELRSGEKDALLTRLRAGQAWITRLARDLSEDAARQHAGGSPDHAVARMAPAAQRWTETWLRLDRYLRAEYGYHGCVLAGEPCRSIGGLLCGYCREGGGG
jgi:hypothetical protein